MKFCPRCDQQFDDSVDLCPEHGLQLLRLIDPNSDQNDPLIGRTIEGRYKIDGRIGQGGMGAVYSATQAVVGRKVAVKVLKPDVAEDVNSVKRFMQEARTASSLSHPNTITIHDFGQTDEGLLYLVMEFVAGETLDALVKRTGGMAPARAVHIIRQILNALQEAHGAGIVHRDLKPENVLISPQAGNPDFLKVLDFGLAKLTGDAGGGLTRTGQVFGTPAYMSPEQARGEPADARADLYAVGCILYELLAGHRPFNPEQPLALLVMHLQDDPPPFASLDPPVEVPEALSDVVMCAMEKMRDARFDSATAMLDALTQAISSAGLRTGFTSSPQLVAPVLAAHLHSTPSMSGSPSNPALDMTMLSTDSAELETASNPALDMTMLPTDSGQIFAADSGAFDQTMLPTDSGQIYGASSANLGSSPALDATMAPGSPSITGGLNSDFRGEVDGSVPRTGVGRGALMAVAGALLAGGVAAAVWWTQRPEPPTNRPAAARPAAAAPVAVAPVVDAAVAVVETAPPERVLVKFNTNPPGARVEIEIKDPDGSTSKATIDVTPGRIELQNGARISATFKLEGHADLTALSTARPKLELTETLYPAQAAAEPEKGKKPKYTPAQIKAWKARMKKKKREAEAAAAAAAAARPAKPPPPKPRPKPEDCLDCDLR